MAQPTPYQPINDIEELLKALEQLFENIANAWSEILFHKDDRQPIKDAWDDVKKVLVSWRDGIDFSATATRKNLTDAGLSGPQLGLKLQLLNRRWEAFFTFGGKKLLKKLLDYINSILKSILGVLPGGEAVQEFKDAIEEAIDEDV